MSLRPQTLASRKFKSLHYASELMSRASITPLDKGCQNWLIEKLSGLGFDCQQFEINGVTNTIAAIGKGEKTKLLVVCVSRRATSFISRCNIRESPAWSPSNTMTRVTRSFF